MVTYYDNEIHYACGHTGTDRSSCQGDWSTAALCPACDVKRDRDINRICRNLTGAVPNTEEGWILRWRLRATTDEVRAALEAKGLPVPDLRRDDGDNLATELRVHAAILRELLSKGGRCACGCGATWNRTVSGTTGVQSAIWGTCPVHHGNACTDPVVGADAVARVQAARESSDRLDMDLDELVEAFDRGGDKS